MQTISQFVIERCDEAEDCLIHGENDEFLCDALQSCIEVFRDAVSPSMPQDRSVLKAAISQINVLNGDFRSAMGHTPKLQAGFFALTGAASALDDTLPKAAAADRVLALG